MSRYIIRVPVAVCVRILRNKLLKSRVPGSRHKLSAFQTQLRSYLSLIQEACPWGIGMKGHSYVAFPFQNTKICTKSAFLGNSPIQAKSAIVSRILCFPNSHKADSVHWFASCICPFMICTSRNGEHSVWNPTAPSRWSHGVMMSDHLQVSPSVAGVRIRR